MGRNLPLPLNDPVNGYDFLGAVAVAFIADVPGGSTAWNWVQKNIDRRRCSTTTRSSQFFLAVTPAI